MLTPYPHLQSTILFYTQESCEDQSNAIRKILSSKSGVAHLVEKLKRCNIQNAELNKAIKDLDAGNEGAMTSFIEAVSSISMQLNIFLPV